MNSQELYFERPEELTATTPPEERGLRRDEVRLLVSSSAIAAHANAGRQKQAVAMCCYGKFLSSPNGHQHTQFFQLPSFLQSGDLLVVNHSATLPANLPAWGRMGNFILNLSTYYDGGLWLAEPRGAQANLALCLFAVERRFI